jgi:putative tricarboxylic transport membrane protein
MSMRGELVFNFALFGVSIYLYYVAGTFRKVATYARIGPEFWPRAILLLIIFLSGILLIRSITSSIKSQKASAPENVSKGIAQEPYRFLLVILVSFGYAFGMGIIGFILSTILFQMVFLYLLKVKRFLSIVLISLLNTAILYIMFIRVLNMILPAGTGLFRTFSLLFY